VAWPIRRSPFLASADEETRRVMALGSHTISNGRSEKLPTLQLLWINQHLLPRLIAASKS